MGHCKVFGFYFKIEPGEDLEHSSDMVRQGLL